MTDEVLEALEAEIQGGLAADNDDVLDLIAAYRALKPKDGGPQEVGEWKEFDAWWCKVRPLPESMSDGELAKTAWDASRAALLKPSNSSEITDLKLQLSAAKAAHGKMLLLLHKALWPENSPAPGVGEKALRTALFQLANEASGFRSMADATIHGNTNMSVLKLRIDEARALLSAPLSEGESK